MHYKRILLSVFLLIFASRANAAPFTVEARTLGMGNAQVASADIATAPFANPAMLSFQPSREDFSLLIGIGAFLSDNDGLVDKIDDFQTAYSNGQAGDPAEAARALSIAQSMLGDVIAPELTGLISTGFSGERWGFALSARSDAIAAGTTLTTNLNDPTQYQLVLEGVLTTEVGVSVATSFDVFGQKLAIGLKPKYVKVDNVFFNEAITTVGTDLDNLLSKDNRTDLGDFTTVDLGLAMGLTKHTQIGLVVTNLTSHEINFINSANVPSTLKFDTQARLGLAYRSSLLTIAADVDLLESDALLTNPGFQALKTQQVSLGAEFNAFDFMQLRIGAMKNIADGISDAAKDPFYTAGVGFWLGFNLDFAVIAQSNSLGGFLQTGFRF